MSDHSGRTPEQRHGTTGHEWDGIHELNTPLPRWWLWLFYATIVWAVGYWVVYPAWPLVSSYTGGVFGWHARSAVADDLVALQQQRAPMMAKLAAASLQEIEKTPQLLDFARALGGRAFADNCAPCHGAGGGGAPGYPNLTDDDWLWGGKLDQIAQTITDGARSGDPKGHQGAMPPWGGVLKPEEIETVADYVRSLSGLKVERAPIWQRAKNSSSPIAPPAMGRTARAISRSDRKISPIISGCTDRTCKLSSKPSPTGAVA